MQQRGFGRTGVEVGEIGLGCWQIGGSWGDVGEDAALETLRAAVETGVNFLDTADVYGDGRSERLIGRFLRESASKPFVATKLGRGGDPGWPGNFTLEAMRRHAEASRERLGVERLDLIQLHCIPTEELRRGEVFEHLRTLQQEGLIHGWGASVESMEEALICIQQPDLTSLQVIFNIFRQKPITTLFDRAEERRTALIVRLPLASGLLSGKITAETQFPPEDHRNFNRDGQAFNVGETFAGLRLEDGVRAAEQIRPLVPEGWTMAQLALRWILDFQAVSVVIPGARNPEQARANASASDLPPLHPQLHERLSEIYKEDVAPKIRGPY
jgi:aryl-alcohol dehydrogenase-like predicted oxidoreductase